MPLFTYRAYDAAGQERLGDIEAPNAGEAQTRLRQQGLLPFSLAESGQEGGAVRGRFRFSLADQHRFSRQIATLLRGGVPLSRALSGMENQDGWSHQRLTLVSLREEVERGRDLSLALAESGQLYSTWALSVIRVGEATGKMDEAFAELAQHMTRVMEHRRRMIAALAYPALMAILATGVMAFLMVYLIPSVEQMFADLQGRLPWVTRLLITVSTLVRRYGLLGVGGVLLALALARVLALGPVFRRRLEVILLAIPLLGPLVRDGRLEGWVRNLAMMIRCGVPLLEAVQLSRSDAVSILEGEALARVEQSLVKGETFTLALRKAEAFPALLVQMTEAGEAAGRLPEMLAEVAGEMEADSATRIEVLLNLLEPLLIVGMGVVVGAIMVGVLLPIYEMNRLLR